MKWKKADNYDAWIKLTIDERKKYCSNCMEIIQFCECDDFGITVNNKKGLIEVI